MRVSPKVVLVLGLAFGFGDVGCSCIGPKTIQRPYPKPSAQQVLDDLDLLQQRARSFKIESQMDYWVGDDRVKGAVLLMGRSGARVRINALSPTGDNVAVDLACDGIDFKLIDYQNNCQLTGPCTRDSIAQLLRISLEPDEFMLLAMGTTPVLTDARATLAWDENDGHEVVELRAEDGSGSQTITLSGRHCGASRQPGACPWDLVSSVLRDANGNELWNLQNKDFADLRGEDGTPFRVPAKTQFKQPAEEADLLVRWERRMLNLEVDSSRFDMEIPPGLPWCGERSRKP